MRSLFLVALLLLAGCSAPATRVDDRQVIVYIPSSAVKPAPLVVMLHGGFGSASQAQRAYGWDALALEKGFIVAYPNGYSRSWNAGPSCCGPANRDGVDDALFLHTRVAGLVASGDVDPRRVYATGMSNGAMMAYAWACAFPDDLAAIAPVAGTLIASCPSPAPMPVYAIHGTADRNVPIDGGVGPAGVTNVSYLSLSESLAPFLSAASCPATPSSSQSGKYTKNRWQCSGNVVVMTMIVDGGAHDWPEGATNFLWDQLSRHAR